MSLPSRSWLLLAALATSGSICNGDPPPGTPGGSDADIIGPSATGPEPIELDVYLDATTSMEGFVGRESEYGEFLYALEAALTSRWPEADVRYFRFGTRVDSIGRDTFLTAREDPAFYRVPGLFERTNIDSVLVRTGSDRVAVVVTDLFQDEGDTNALVRQVKERVFEQGLAAGLLAVESRFAGRVYDAPGGPYAFASTPGDPATYRPFYALLVGRAPLLRRLVFTTLEGSAAVRPDRFALLSPYVVEAFDVELTKAGGPEGQAINAAGPDGEFRLRGDALGGTLNGRLSFTPAPAAVSFDPTRIELVAYRFAPGEQDSTLTTDVEMENLRVDGNAVTFDLRLAPEGPPGTYRYLLLFRTGDGAVRAPDWVREISTTAPSATADPNKTLNLERLVSNLAQSAATVRRPLVGREVVTLTKQ